MIELKKIYKTLKENMMGKNSPMYLYATEMISEYYSKIGLKNKKVLTIIGSGDQFLNALFHGAKKVVGFDLNEHSIYIVQLKIKAINALSYEEFINYFGTGNLDASFDYKIYKRFSHKLPKKAKHFFDNLYHLYNENGNNVVKSKFFHQRVLRVSPLEINSYLKNKKNFQKIKEIIKRKRIFLVRSGIDKIHKKEKIGKQKFDLINLSNAPNYLVDYLNEKSPVRHFHKNILFKLRDLLESEGKILFYNYCYDKVSSIMNRKENIEKLREKEGFKLEVKKLKSVLKNGNDYAIVLTKRK